MSPQSLHLINQILSLATIAAQIFIAGGLLTFLFLRKKTAPAEKYIARHGIWLAFWVALFSMLASLFYSNIAGFEPCVLCWYQRIFMYPLVFILAVALVKKTRHIVDYLLALPVIGLFISLYHSYLYYAATSGCAISGRGVSCTQRYVFEFGYVTIPMMALTAFVLIILFLVAAKSHDEGR